MSADGGAPRTWRRPPPARRARSRGAEPPPRLQPAPGDLAALGHPRAGSAAPAALPARRADAGALAGAFGVDFLSWDESDPGRRGRALAPYVEPPVREERLAATGWSGLGRQRGELALPGAVIALADDRLLVHVRVRVTPFRRVSETPTCIRHSTDVLPYPAAAPAPSDPEWVGLDSYWYELLVPVREVTDRWRVDIGAVVVVPPVPTEVHDGAVPP